MGGLRGADIVLDALVGSLEWNRRRTREPCGGTLGRQAEMVQGFGAQFLHAAGLGLTKDVL